MAGQNKARREIQAEREKEGRVRKAPAVAAGVRCQSITGKPRGPWQYR